MPGYMRQLSENKFQFEVSHGKDGMGNRKKAYKTVEVTGSTPEAKIKKAEKQLALFVAEVEKGDYQKPTHYTFASFVEVWKKAAERDLEPKTFHRYMEMLNKRIIPEIGNTKLEQITAIQLDGLYDKMRLPQKKVTKLKDGSEKVTEYILSEQTILHHHRIICTILERAKKKDFIKENPCEKADSPKVANHKPDTYELDDINKLVSALYSVPPEEFKYSVACLIALTGGLRLGEVMGLQHNDFEFSKNTIDIQRSRQYVPGKGSFIKGTKNYSSERVITMPQGIMDLIADLEHENKVLKVKLGSQWKGYANEDEEKTAPLFIGADGQPMFPNYPSTWFNDFLKKNSLKPLPYHGLRHTSATYLINQGESVTTVSKRLGHARKSTTLNIYAHSFNKADVQAATKMDNIVPKRDNNSKAN